MNKTMKPGTSLSVVDAQVKNDTLSHLKINQEQRDYATAHGLDLNGPAEQRWEAAVNHQDAVQKHFAALGLVMLSLKTDLPHGEFQREVEARGFEARQTQRAMGYAQFVFSRPKVEQGELLKLSHTKVCALAAADPEVIELVMQDGIEEIDAYSVRGFRQKMADLRAQITDLSVQRDTAQGERDSLAQQLQRRSTDNGDSVVPMVVADLRAEMAALVKKAELAITSLYPVGVEVMGLRGTVEANEWAEPTLRLGLSGLLAVRELVDGTIKSFGEAMGEHIRRLQSGPDVLAFLDESEIKSVAEEWEKLTAVHQHEAALRAYERENARPRAKGRPKSAPVAPGAKS